MNSSRQRLLAGATVVAVTAISSSALAQASATASGTASVLVGSAIDVVKNTDLTFGRVILPTSGSTVYSVAASDGQASTSGGNGQFSSGSGSPARAQFTVAGEGGQAFNISADPSVNAGGVTINLLTSAATGALSGTVGSPGTATFGVGGNVTLTNGTSTGVKSGSFNVTVGYQ